MPRPLLLLALLAPLALAACGKKSAAETPPEAVAEVTTAVLQDGSLDTTLTAYGAAEFAPGAEATLTAPMEAVVGRLESGPGARVHAGQPVAILSPSAQSRVDLAKATSDAAAAAAALARAQRLRASGLDSNADVETARAAAATAEAGLRSLRARAGGLTVRSPTAGVVETLTAAPGDLLAAGASLGKIGRLADLRLRLGVDPAQTTRISVGAPVRLTPLAAGGAGAVTGTVSGTVRLIDPRLDPQTHAAGVIVAVAGVTLDPGEAMRGEIVLGRLAGPLAPRRAIYYDGDKPYVLVVDKGVAHKREVTLGATQGDTVLIASGARAGERIVTDGGASLDDGAAVREQAPAAAGKDAGG